MSPRSPRVSIGLPVHNGQNFIGETLDSILGQSYTDFELIISDNASTDLTGEICRSYAAKDSRIRFYRSETNRGAVANYNFTFRQSCGEYFKWAAHDDICAPDYVHRCVEILEGKPTVVVCFPRTVYINERGEYLKANRGRYSIRGRNRIQRLRQLINHEIKSNEIFWSIFGVMRAGALRKTGLLGHFMGSDQVLLMELVLLGDLYEAEEWLFFRREHRLASTEINPLTYHQRASWWDPNYGGRIVLPNWRRLVEHLGVTRRHQFRGYETAAAYYLIAKRFAWRWERLGRELISIVPQAMKRDIF